MILWTITTPNGWNELNRQGYLTASHKVIPGYKDLEEAYRWMASQMKSRLGPPPKGTRLPLWAWYQWEGRTGKPDLRSGGHLPKGQQGFRIEFEKGANEVLLSDFDRWHHVLNYFYLPKSKKDDDRFEKKLSKRGLECSRLDKPLPDAALHEEIVTSWDRIFDLEWEDPWIALPKKSKSIQATFWRLDLGEIREVKEFIAR